MRNLEVNLPQLQNLIKRDRMSYEAEAIQQLNHVHSLLQITFNHPQQQPPSNLHELLSFSAHIIPCYPLLAICKTIPIDTAQLLQLPTLHVETRRSAVAALILLANRGIVDRLSVLPLFFSLLRSHDKQLRLQIYTHIVNDIKNANLRSKNNKLNKYVLNFLFSFISPPPGYKYIPNKGSHEEGASTWSPIAARLALQICIDLYKKHIWNDTKTVNIIADACFSPAIKIMTTAAHFFLTTVASDGDTSESEEENALDLDRIKHQVHINKKTRANSKKVKTALAVMKKKQKKKSHHDSSDFSALQLLHDPQTFAEKLFNLVKNPQLSGHSLSFDVKLTLLNLISRLIGSNKLLIISLYSYMQKYLQPHQPSVTSLLAYTAQSAHDLVPPDALSAVVRTIADNFVNEHSSGEVIAAGLNSIREICARCPLAMEEDLLLDLTQYKSSREKGVVMASRSLIGLFREVNPHILKKTDRGKTANMDVRDGSAKVLSFGATQPSLRVAGAELLEAHQGDNVEDDDADAWEGWEVASNDSDDSGGEWMDVPEDQMEFFDSESNSDSDSEVEEESKENMVDVENAVSAVEQNAPKPLPIEACRFLTPTDFAKMAELRAAAALDSELNPKKGTSNRKRALQAAEEEKVSEFVTESDLLPHIKKRKATYDERIASIMTGREGREKYSGGAGKGKKTGGASNQEKRKTKNFMMMVHGKKVHSKKKMSLRDRQKVIRTHIKKQKMGK